MQIYQKSLPYTNKLLQEQVTGPKVLDIAGAEYVGRANMLTDNGYKVTLIDLHEPWGELHSDVMFVKMPVEKIETGMGCFDDILLSNALEHFDSPQLALEAIQKVMTIHSKVHILTPNRESLNRRIGYLMGKMSSLEEIPQKELELGHKHTFSVESMTDLLHRAGYEIICCKGIFLKPVPTDEMIQWSEERIKAFFDIADQLPPELCHEVYFQAQMK